jgi:hypothetical protein
MRSHHHEIRVLSLAPISRGLGFAVLEGPQTLIDWGVKSARANKNVQSLAKARELIQHYQPDVLVLEDCKGSRRGKRVQQLIRSIVELCTSRNLKTRCFSQTKVKEVFAAANAVTKHEIAFASVEQLPELAPHFPPRRQPWMNEDPRMSIFDAVARALTFFHLSRKGNAAAVPE